MTSAVVGQAIGGAFLVGILVVLLVSAIGALMQLRDVIRQQAVATTTLAHATTEAAEQTRQSIVAARAQLEMNRQLVEAVRAKPPGNARAH